MKKFDLIVIGAGSGLTVSSTMASQGWHVAVIDPGPFGGTCLNRGCIPSKMLIHAADLAEQIQHAKEFGIQAEFQGIDLAKLSRSVFKTIDADAKAVLQANLDNKLIQVYRHQAKFVESNVIDVGGEKITGDKIIIAAGGRPFIPPIPGLEDVEYLTSKEALRLRQLPKSLVVIGGGYISAELSHFFGALGTKVTILERGDKLLGREDEEISQAFTDIFSKKHKVILGANATRVSQSEAGISVQYEDLDSGKKKSVKAEQLLVVVGRRPNTDVLNLAHVGYKLNKRGFVETNEFLETSVKGVWALGDIAGNWAFKHSANYEAEIIVRNFFLQKKELVNYTGMPHAVFSSPQIAGVGKTEQELIDQGINYKKARYDFKHSGMGMALKDNHSFIKVLSDEKAEYILGCHILGHEASTLIHQVLPFVRNKRPISELVNTIHIHPALSEVVHRAVAKL